MRECGSDVDAIAHEMAEDALDVVRRVETAVVNYRAGATTAGRFLRELEADARSLDATAHTGLRRMTYALERALRATTGEGSGS